ncbi:3',5'-cyclic-nucleotide phosphodiesterase [Methylobacterium sp. J-048]|uniref:3',5'-cyclic-nucleotide phosphodiesterase n=2 Tax=unclassified Methylobacterium TaxID=2615210 RepID=UPI001FBA620C|nr:3',5'-cyclic-nucleotide phosphodiesterase [Methylobacterium sp. J-048]MCJ2055059.1 3',5'-cyclic-nucleotide phosphodiesterase [Methylobacterium sp. J-048]
MRSFLLAFALIAVAAPALAAPDASASKRGNKDLKTYCSGDAVTFCSGDDPDSPEMDACFKKNMDKISENCRRAITAYKGGGGK